MHITNRQCQSRVVHEVVNYLRLPLEESNSKYGILCTSTLLSSDPLPEPEKEILLPALRFIFRARSQKSQFFFSSENIN